MKASKNYTSSPLPFMGQKRRFLKKFKEVLINNKPDATYVDLFGGSGLLSHIVKQYYPEATVVYNDYDNFSERLLHIDQTNELLASIRYLIKDLPNDKAIPVDRRQPIIDCIYAHEKRYGYVDYVSISSNLLFAMNYAKDMDQLSRQVFYKTIRESSYNADGYLEGVERVSMDYKSLFERYKDQSNVVFLVDPPYLSTEISVYKSSHWKLSDYLDVLDVLKVPHYYYFTSNKSQIVELCEWLGSKVPGANPFGNTVLYSNISNVNYSSKYTDIMIVK